MGAKVQKWIETNCFLSWGHALHALEETSEGGGLGKLELEVAG